MHIAQFVQPIKTTKAKHQSSPVKSVPGPAFPPPCDITSYCSEKQQWRLSLPPPCKISIFVARKTINKPRCQCITVASFDSSNSRSHLYVHSSLPSLFPFRINVASRKCTVGPFNPRQKPEHRLQVCCYPKQHRFPYCCCSVPNPNFFHPEKLAPRHPS